MTFPKPLRRAIWLAVLFCFTSAGQGRGEGPALEARIGFNGWYKLGCWTPVWIAGNGGEGIRIAAPDADGVTLVTPWPNGEPTPEVAYARLGRQRGKIQLLPDGDRSEVIEPAGHQPLPATDRLIVTLTADRSELFNRAGAAVANLTDIEALPDQAIGYDGVDAVLLVLGQESVSKLAAHPKRVAALREWVERGGRLIVSCQNEKQHFAEHDKSLGWMLPGTPGEPVPLPTATPLERWIDAEQPIALGDEAILATTFTDIAGEVLIDAGRGEADLPLVTRFVHGFGQVTFVAFDLDHPELARWPGRSRFSERLIDFPESRGSIRRGAAEQSLVARSYNDLSGALWRRLGAGFEGVHPPSLFAVAGFVLLFLAFVGPIDYLLVRKLGRPAAAWVSLPVWLLLFGGGAAWLSGAARGNGAKVNQAAIIDVDVPTGQLRGAFWGQIYLPAAGRLDLATEPAVQASEVRLTWFGLPGESLGAMRSQATGAGRGDLAYGATAQLDQLIGLPIDTGSTAAIASRWYAPVEQSIEAVLQDTGDGLVEGELVNNTGENLTECELLYGDWAWNLRDLAAGDAAIIDTRTAPLRYRTIVTQDHTLPGKHTVGGADALTTGGLLRAMMFHHLLGAERLTGVPNRYQAFTDLSDLLEAGRAILVCRSSQPATKLIANKQPLDASPGADWTYYRFVLKVEEDS